MATEAPGVPGAGHPGAGDGPEEPDPLVPALSMLTRALGIRLPGDVVRGPLLTVQRRPV